MNLPESLPQDLPDLATAALASMLATINYKGANSRRKLTPNPDSLVSTYK